MTIAECYDKWSQDPDWTRLANSCRLAVKRALISSYGDRDINELSEETLDDWVCHSRVQYFEKVQTRSVITHMMAWAAIHGHFNGKVHNVRTTISIESQDPVKPQKAGKHKVWHTGTIYTEMHNHGRRSNGSQDGNRSSVRLTKGVGMTRCYGYRWVAEIQYHRKRYRCRSYSFTKVRAWLDEMTARFSE